MEEINIAGKSFPKPIFYAVGAGAVGFVAYKWWTAGRSGSDNEVVDTTPDVSSLEPSQVPGGSGGTTSGTYDQTPTGYQNDQEWFNDAKDKLIYDYGVSDIATASETLNRYLNQQPLTPEQHKQIAYVINSIGPPPTGSRNVREETPKTQPAGLSAPGNFRAIAISRTSITVAWNSVPGADHYRLTRQGGGRGVLVKGTSHTSPSLKPNTRYLFIVRAANGSGSAEVGGPSSQLTVTTKR